jgi:hypothetical protein
MFEPFFITRTDLPRINQIFEEKVDVAHNADVYKISRLTPGNLSVLPCKQPLTTCTGILFDLLVTIYVLRKPEVMQYIRKYATTLSEKCPLIIICGGTTVNNELVPILKIHKNGTTEIQAISPNTPLMNAYQLIYKN